jgi:hypothetical protein
MGAEEQDDRLMMRMMMMGESRVKSQSRLNTQESRLKSQESRVKTLSRVIKTQSRVKTQESRVKTESSRVKTQDSRVKSQDSRLKTQDSRVKTQESRLKSQESRLIKSQSGGSGLRSQEESTVTSGTPVPVPVLGARGGTPSPPSGDVAGLLCVCDGRCHCHTVTSVAYYFEPHFGSDKKETTPGLEAAVYRTSNTQWISSPRRSDERPRCNFTQQKQPSQPLRPRAKSPNCKNGSDKREKTFHLPSST